MIKLTFKPHSLEAVAYNGKCIVSKSINGGFV